MRSIVLIIVLLGAGFLVLEHLTPHSSVTVAAAERDAPSTVDMSGAKRLFCSYVSLSQAYDPAVGDLYTDTANITYTRRYPSGTVSELSTTGAELKRLLPAAAAAARAKQLVEIFTHVTYQAQSDGTVLITATRWASGSYTAPYSMQVKLVHGEWKIVEEVVLSLPPLSGSGTP